MAVISSTSVYCTASGIIMAVNIWMYRTLRVPISASCVNSRTNSADAPVCAARVISEQNMTHSTAMQNMARLMRSGLFAPKL